jgi:hypothetical protein
MIQGCADEAIQQVKLEKETITVNLILCARHAGMSAEEIWDLL